MVPETDRAYIAGLFDGEGSIHFKRGIEKKKKHRGKPGYRLSADSDGYNIARGNDIVNEEKPESKFNYNYGFIKDYNPEELTPNDEFDQIIISSDNSLIISNDIPKGYLINTPDILSYSAMFLIGPIGGSVSLPIS